MDFLPVFLDIRGLPCLVVGGGDAAARRAALLLRAGAQVMVQAPELIAGFAADLDMARVSRRATVFRDEDITSGSALVRLREAAYGSVMSALGRSSSSKFAIRCSWIRKNSAVCRNILNSCEFSYSQTWNY